MSETSLTIAEKFWSRVDPSGDCWIWQGGQYHKGYGVFSTGTWRKGNRQRFTAHRFAWEFENGSIPTGMSVLHRCDNPPCVRLSHLFLGTVKDNQQDMSYKGRGRNGRTERTHCPQGHPYDEENTYIYPVTGYRQCRACQAQQREHRRQQNAA